MGTELADAGPQGSVVACCAFIRSYREVRRRAAPQTIFIQLDVDSSVLQERLLQRPGHFMPATLLASQLATLEPLEADEAGDVDLALIPTQTWEAEGVTPLNALSAPFLVSNDDVLKQVVAPGFADPMRAGLTRRD